MASFLPPRKMNNCDNEFRGYSGRSAYNSPVLQGALKFRYEGLSTSTTTDDSNSSPPQDGYISPMPTFNAKPRRTTPSVQSLPLTVPRVRFNSSSHDTTFGSPRGTPRNFAVTRCTLPPRAYDEAMGVFKMTYSEILKEQGMLESFAKDKFGCRYLQDNYPEFGTEDRQNVFAILDTETGLFEELSKDVFGNFLMQIAIEKSRNCEVEQRFICMKMLGNFYQLSNNRYSCRVVQKAFELFSSDLKTLMLMNLQCSLNLLKMATDPNANHVIQKIFNVCSIPSWAFILEAIIDNRNGFFEVAESKYGCRVIQVAIEVLSSDSKYHNETSRLLKLTMSVITKHCDRLVTNEFANYVIQNVFMTGKLADYRDDIIDRCLLRHLLSLSQEKYASHVIEKALEFAPPNILKDMMDEIFDGYVPHPETKKDALDVLLLHQYGNYVVQRMLAICCEAVRAKRDGIELSDMETRLRWFDKLTARIMGNCARLERYSSGKKILETLRQLQAENTRPARRFNSFPPAHRFMPMPYRH